MKINRVLISLLLLLTLPLAALAAEDIRFDSIAEIEVEVVEANGTVVMVRQPAAKVTPGTTVIFTNRFTNDGKEAAENLVITNPIPEQMEYLAGTARGNDAEVTFSVDGKTFAAPEELIVTNAAGQTRPAGPGDYTHIRWQLVTSLAPDGSGAVEYRARLK